MRKHSFICLVVLLFSLSSTFFSCKDSSSEIEKFPTLSVKGLVDNQKIIGIDEEFEMKIDVSDRSKQEFIFTVEPPCFAKFDGKRKLKGKKVGEATVVVKAKGNEKIKGSFNVKVVEYPTLTVEELKEGELVLEKEQVVDLNVLASNGESLEYIYSIISGTAVELSATGKLTAIQKGEATVSVKAKSNAKLNTSFKVVVKDIATISVDNLVNGFVALTKDEKFNIVVRTDNGFIHDYFYTVENDGIVDIDEMGKMTAIGLGKTKVTVTAKHNAAITSIFDVQVSLIKLSVANLSAGGIELLSGKSFYILVSPSDGGDYTYEYSSFPQGVVTIDENGKLTAVSPGTSTVRVSTNVADSKVSTEFNVKVIGKPKWYERTGWEASATYSVKPSNNESHIGSPSFVIDGVDKTCLSMVKPGKKFGGVDASSAKMGDVYFTIDTKQSTKFSLVKLRHRTDVTGSNLRIQKLKIQGSNDGLSFTNIKEMDVKHDNKTVEVVFALEEEYAYRYIRIVPTKWAPGGNTMQVSEFNLAYKE